MDNNHYSPPQYPYYPGHNYPHVPPQSNPYPPPNTVAQPVYPPPPSQGYTPVYPPPPSQGYTPIYPPPPSQGYTSGSYYPPPSVSQHALSSIPYPAPTFPPSSQADYSHQQYHGYTAPPPSLASSTLPTLGSPHFGSPHHFNHHSFEAPNVLHGYASPPSFSSAQPTLQTVGSSHYGSSHHYPVNSQLSYQDSLSSSVESSPHSYPPIDGLSNLSLSEPSAPASPAHLLLPGGKYHSGPLPRIDKLDCSGTIYQHSSNSFSGLQAGNVAMQAVAPYSGGMQLVPFSSSGTSLKVLLLHGNLDIWVKEARNLPNMDMFHKTVEDVFNRLPGSLGRKIEGQISRQITSDPYVSTTIAGATIARTYVISNDENPRWMQNFVVPVAHHAAELKFVVKDNDVVGSQIIGTVSIPVEKLYRGEKVEGTFPILNSSGKPCKVGAVLNVSVQYNPIELLRMYHHGIGAGPIYEGVPGTYFPLRKGGRVTLYQDAHAPDGSLPNLKLGNGNRYVHGKCWHDIFDAIGKATKLIYITGWSVWHKLQLVRDDSSVSNLTLGELLRIKSQEGVRVLLLVWDDPTSRNILGYRTDGVMQTHDEETRRFFKHSSVRVLLCPRVAGKRHSWVKQKEVGTIYTHHQKTVIVDVDAGYNRRRIVSFLGGLDLCDGRYDTPRHSLYRTLQTLHADDYHNPTYVGDSAGCPREPWHDLHCKIDGPAAYDVLTNFEERWLKASKPHGIKKLKSSYDDSLLRRVPEILSLSDAVHSMNDDDPDGWHVQMFRSIDSNSVKGFPKNPKDATEKNLICGKNVLIDKSIHTAYVKAIRAAQHFIYIENQYFIGSSFNWNQNKDLGANNLIPMEIVLKIAEKIRAGERFAAYILIPMWPEGNPTGAATQRILFWQHKTMQMMYETIYKALVEVGRENDYSPQDYLNFFCLGNREVSDIPGNLPTASNPQGLSRKNRRFMIYIHSKGMIVDDEFVLIGSANINERSMDGSRDTEIAMGAYQPYHTWGRRSSGPQGDVYGYRMSLWGEHLGFLEETFTTPGSLECVRRVRSLAEANWNQYVSPEVTEMSAHLLKYPVDVDRTGKVRPLPGCETFPDVGGNIVGSFLAIQENLTI